MVSSIRAGNIERWLVLSFLLKIPSILIKNIHLATNTATSLLGNAFKGWVVLCKFNRLL